MTVSLLEPVLALQSVEKLSKNAPRGIRIEIPAGATLEICGPGFNDETVKVRVGGHIHFVLLEDIEPRQSFHAAPLPYLAA